MELRPDVSLVVVVNDKEQVLVIRRSELSSDTGRWESPVGHRDSGETAREAALREVKEETGLDVTLFPESFEKKNPDGKTIAVFMAKADTEEVKLEPKEHDSFKWLTLKEVADLSPTHPSYKSDVRKIIKMNAAKQEKEAMAIGRGYLPPQLRQNNYLATYPLGARMPAKPNPAAQVKPKAIKADAQGVQAAMNKMGAEKQARNLGLGDVPAGAGPQQMANALNMLNQAKILVNTPDTLRKHQLTPRSFEPIIDSLADSEEESFDFDNHRADAKTRSILTGLAGAGLGGGVGYLGGGLGGALGGAALGGLGGAGYGYLNAANHNQNLTNTAKVLREYGLLRPEYLRQAIPLLKASAEKKEEHTAKMKTNDWSTGNAAIDSLKEHMRKSGFDSFQMSFFTRLAEQGYTAEQVKQAVAKVESIDKEAADSLKSGFEKIANPWLSAAMRAGSSIKNQLPGIGKAIWNGGKGAVGKVRGNIASLQSSATKSPLITAKALAPRAGIGAVAGATNPSAPDASTAFSDPLGYATRVAPHMAAGALTTTIGGKPATRFARGAVSGFGTGQGTGMVTDALGYTNNARVNLGNAGWGLGGLGSASRVVKPETLAKFDPITLGLKVFSLV